MFREVKVRGWLQRFLGPVLGAREVAMGVVKLLDEGKGGEVRLPTYAALVPWLLVLPSGMARLLRDFSGVDAVVDVKAREIAWPSGEKANGGESKDGDLVEESESGEE